MDGNVIQGLAAIVASFLVLIGQLLRDRKELKQAREQLAAKERVEGPKEAWQRLDADYDRAVEEVERYRGQRDAAEVALDELRAKHWGALEEVDKYVGECQKLRRQLEEERIEKEALKRELGRA